MLISSLDLLKLRNLQLGKPAIYSLNSGETILRVDRATVSCWVDSPNLVVTTDDDLEPHVEAIQDAQPLRKRLLLDIGLHLNQQTPEREG